ncbi:ATP-binding protein [Bacillus velezensis]|uniref:ATP-binding protein n=1 Tax=Bacillus amyloliquefaciens group TaxID=1938374 RepID=UPI000C058BC6|nr:ATP-binding protein [Bacillus velezensis]ATO08502.1 DNA replication protein [Bacillus velezensis]ATO12234.1 DNA replication protein [Bacillus velezensis]
MTNENTCVLADGCKAAGTDACTRHCTHFITMHGASGEGGRSGAAGLPREYRLVTLKNSPARAALYIKKREPSVIKESVTTMAEAYVKSFERQFDQETGIISPADRIKSMYLVSEKTGTGKTTTAAALLNEWLRVHYSGSLRRGLTPLQRPAYFLDVNEWQTEFNLATMANDDEGMAEFQRKMKLAMSAPFAVLDDIGVRDCTPAFRGYLHAVINARVTNQLPTIYTSNIALDSLADVFKEKRLADRVGDLCREIEFVGESKRGMRR